MDHLPQEVGILRHEERTVWRPWPNGYTQLAGAACLVASLLAVPASAEPQLEVTNWVAHVQGVSGASQLILTASGNARQPGSVVLFAFQADEPARSLWSMSVGGNTYGDLGDVHDRHSFALSHDAASLFVVHLRAAPAVAALLVRKLDRAGGGWLVTQTRAFQLEGVPVQSLYGNLSVRALPGQRLQATLFESGLSGKVRHVRLDLKTGSAVDVAPTAVPEATGPVSPDRAPTAPALVHRSGKHPVLLNLAGLTREGDETFLRWTETSLGADNAPVRVDRRAPWKGAPDATLLGVGWDPHFGWAYVVSRTEDNVEVYRCFVGAKETTHRPMSPDTGSLVSESGDHFRLAFGAPAAVARSKLRRVEMFGPWLAIECENGTYVTRPVEGDYVRQPTWLALPVAN